MKKILLLILIAFCLDGWGQQIVTIELQVFDCTTEETLPFANVRSITNKTGTATNFEGLFSFESNLTDTLIISFIGYKNQIILVKDYLNTNKICLTTKNFNISDVTISAKSNFLYKMLSDCRKNKITDQLHSKTYFLLKSEVNQQQVELVEAYYNGTFQNHNISKLDLKIGRAYLTKFNKNCFVSMGTSNGINLHQTFDFNLYFPSSPLEWNEQKLKKKFNLTFHDKFREDNKTIYVIDFKELNKEGKFKGRVWVDSANKVIRKLKLLNEQGANSPFLPVGDAKEIKYVSFDITKTYKLEEGHNVVQSIDFNYDLEYVGKDKQPVKVSTKAVLFAYDYKNQFVLPRFKKGLILNDYQGISLAPYNNFFWDNHREFQLNALEKEKQLFIRNDSTNFINSFSYNSMTNKISFTEPTYRKWSKHRINIIDFGHKNVLYSHNNIHSKYNLVVMIFMDINKIEDSLNVQLSTILDPFRSFSNLEDTQNSSAFISMYFDLVEIEKRNLKTKIEGIDSEKEIIMLYEVANKRLNNLSSIFFTETAAGTNKKGMKNWNEYIIENIGIDNLSYFEVTFKY